MKRNPAFFVVIVAVLILARSAAAQTSPNAVPRDRAHEQLRDAEKRLADVVNNLPPMTDSPTEPPADLRGKLRPLVEETFHARQRLQRAELAELRRRIEEIERALEQRESNKDAIISSRLEALLAGPTEQKAGFVEQRFIEERIENGQRRQVPVVVRVPAVNRATTPDGQRPVLIEQPAATDAATQRHEDAKAGESAPPRERTFERATHEEFDPETREQLAQVDLQAAEAELADAEKDLKNAQAGHKTGALTDSQMQKFQRDFRGAQLGVERAKIKLEALAKQRAERTPVVAPRRDTTDRPPTSADEARRPSSDDFDLDTRERLAEVEVRQADAKKKVAEYEFRAHYEANQKAPGSTPKAELKKLEMRWQAAEIERERADVVLQGIRGQRADLEAAADIAVAEAEAEVQKAKAAIEVQAAARQSSFAQSQKAAADMTAAEANYEYRKKQYARIKGLFESKGVEEKLLDEAEEQLTAAKASLDGDHAAVAVAASNVARGDATRVELEADLRIAEARLRAAQQRRDRLIHRDVVDQKGGPGTPPSQPGNEGALPKSE